MADNVGITTGTDASIATDDCGSAGHIQRIKLDIGGDGVSSPVVAGNGLPVGVESLPGTVATDITDIKKAVEILDNAISDNEMQVDIVGALPAGTNAIGGVTGTIAHDSATTANPLMQGGYASAAAPTSVSADGDAVRAWFLRNGAQATVLTAAGALIGGDAANGIDVDVTRLPTLANVTTVATVTNITNQGQLVDNAGFTDGTTRLMMSGYIFDEVAGTALTENDGAAARVDSKRAQVMVVEDATTRGQRQAVDASGNAAVAPKPTTAGGLSIGKLISANSTNATSLKGSAGQVYTIYAHNVNAAVRYLKLYNKASSPTVGTDTPVITFPIPGNTAGNGAVLDTGGMGIAFATGIAYAVTTGVADSDTAAVAANEIVLTILYK